MNDTATTDRITLYYSPQSRATGARVPQPGQRRTGSVCTSETSSENDSSHFWH